MTLLFVLYVVVPIAAYLFLASARGRAAIAGFVLAGLALGALWLSYLLEIEPLFTGDGRAVVFATAAAVLLAGAVALALLARLARVLFGLTRKGVYLILVVVLLVVVGTPVVMLWGL